MKKTRLFPLLGLMAFLTISLSFTACNDDDDPIPVEAFITEFAVTNAGADGDVRIEGVISDLSILVVVPFETDVTGLITDITLSLGASVIPSSGTAVDFTGPRSFIVENGEETNVYTVTVELAEPTVGVISDITLVSIDSQVEYPAVISQSERTIAVTYNNLQSPMVVIESIDLAPAGTTYSTSSGTDTLNLESPNLIITATFAGESTDYTVITNVTEAGFNPENTQTLLDFSSVSNNVPSRLNDELSRSASFDGRYVFAVTRKEGNAVLYWDAQNPTAEPGSLHLGETVSGGTWLVSDVVTTPDGSIYVSNMTWNEGGNFKVYKWADKDDQNPEVVLSYTLPQYEMRIGDAISVIGNPPANGYIFASNFPILPDGFNTQASEFLRWNFNEGNAGAPEIIQISPQLTARLGQYGIINPIPGESDRFLVSGAEMTVAVIDVDGNILYEMPETVNGGIRAYDPNVFEYNDGRYLTYTFNNEGSPSGAYMEIVNISGATDIVEALQQLNDGNIADRRVYKHVFGNIADTWISARNSVGFSNDGKPRVMSFTVRNGFIVKEFSN